MVGAGAQVTRGGSGAAPGREAGAGAAGARGSPGASPSREAGAEVAGTRGSPQSGGGRHCLDLILVRGGTRYIAARVLMASSSK
jgi:hypothetical protein